MPLMWSAGWKQDAHIRSSKGHPLLGDQVYGSARNPYHLQGQALHAMILGFVHPRTGEYMEFEAPLPEYFIKLLEILKKVFLRYKILKNNQMFLKEARI